MKHFLVLLVAGSLLSIVFFGFLFMTGGLHDMTRCFAAALQGRDCPESAGWLSMAAFHLNALKLFSMGIVSFMLSILIVAVLFAFSIEDLLKLAFKERVSLLDFSSFLPTRKFLYWLSLNLHSPPLM